MKILTFLFLFLAAAAHAGQGCADPVERYIPAYPLEMAVQECLNDDGSSTLYIEPWFMPKAALTAEEVAELARVIVDSRELLHQLRVELVSTLGKPTPEEIERMQNLFYQLDAVLASAPWLLSKRPFQ